MSCIVNQFAIFMLPDISSIKCPKERMKRQMHSTTIHRNSVYNASDDEECLVAAIIYCTLHLTLRDCLKICHHYESLQYHLNVVKLTDKPTESITKCHFNRGGRQPSAGVKKSATFRSHPSTKPVNSTNNTVQCSNCNTTHLKN